MASCTKAIDDKREFGEKDTKSDDFDPTHTPVDQGTQILYNAEINKNGIRLHPQPTADSLDPLNWSSLQKHGILSIVMLKYVQKQLRDSFAIWLHTCQKVNSSLHVLLTSSYALLDISYSHTSRPPQFHHLQRFKINTRLAIRKSTGQSPYRH